MIVYNNQQQLTGHCSFQEYSVLLQSPPCNNGNQGQHAIIAYNDLHLKMDLSLSRIPNRRNPHGSVHESESTGVILFEALKG